MTETPLPPTNVVTVFIAAVVAGVPVLLAFLKTRGIDEAAKQTAQNSRQAIWYQDVLKNNQDLQDEMREMRQECKAEIEALKDRIEELERTNGLSHDGGIAKGQQQ